MLRSTRTTVASSSRALFSTSTRRHAASESPDSPTEGVTPAAEEAPAATSPIASGQKNGYRAWLSGEGSRYRRPLPGKPNWIGDTPFPLNPTFNPLPPLADVTKTRIYNAYLHNILQKDATDSQVVRAVSTKFGVAMDRVRAIVRLKELERRFKSEGRPLQTELLKGMESHLGVKQPAHDSWRGIEMPEPAVPKLASSKTVFEMVDVESGDSPVFLPLLSRVPLRSNPLSELPADSSATSAAIPSTSATGSTARRTKVVPASRPGRAPTAFTDLSGTKQGREMMKTYEGGTKRGNGGELARRRAQHSSSE
ncbi:hypothetical protein JCM8115_002768 [Rhodotorula mucilaginosa]|uniref:Eukaryotic mitochondrial regulator protein-domain-containing protein n=1 Tax=Rhodotorula mucilaginosa TaxID=5537 RepID=A0A9P6VX59_RHOMI|nr:hypothetical protein C6P46_007036 [Rhodotorula mucilaginosa]